DTSGGAARFRRRRCLLREARLAVDEQHLEQWLRSRRLAGYGIEEPTVRITAGEVLVAFTARVGARSAPATCRLTVEALGLDGEGQRARVVINELRLYGYLPAPAPLVGLALLLGMSGGAKNGAPAHSP